MTPLELATFIQSELRKQGGVGWTYVSEYSEPDAQIIDGDIDLVALAEAVLDLLAPSVDNPAL